MNGFMKLTTFAVMLFAGVLASVIGARLDQNTVLLLGGATLGLLVAAPSAAVITYLALRRRDEQSFARSPNYSAPMPHNPPQYWVMPSVQTQPIPTTNFMPPQRQLPAANPQLTWTQPPEFNMPRRKFYMIGDAGEVQELNDDSQLEPNLSFG